MEVICLHDEAFYALIERVVERVKEKQNNSSDKWISGDQAMKILRITSKTTLQKLCDEGKVRFSQLEKKIILYDMDSINLYLTNIHTKLFRPWKTKNKTNSISTGLITAIYWLNMSRP